MNHPTSSRVAFKLGDALPPMPMRPAAPERQKPFRSSVQVERFWLLFARGRVSPENRLRALELGLNPATRRPRLLWRRYPHHREPEAKETAAKLALLGFAVSSKLVAGERKRRSQAP